MKKIVCFPFGKRSNSKHLTAITLGLLGIDNSGKTTISLGLTGESIDSVKPTNGFNKAQLETDRCSVTLYDLGGGPNIRNIWSNYYAFMHGVIFVIDSADMERLHEVRQTLEKLISQELIRQKPILILANKQDIETALDESEILEYFNIEQLVNDFECPCKIRLCSAIRGIGPEIDGNIVNGLEWLMSNINYQAEFAGLAERVKNDVNAHMKSQEREKAERRKRVEERRRQRELEQEKQEQEAIQNAVSSENNAHEENTDEQRDQTADNESNKGIKTEENHEQNNLNEIARDDNLNEIAGDDNLRENKLDGKEKEDDPVFSASSTSLQTATLPAKSTTVIDENGNSEKDENKRLHHRRHRNRINKNLNDDDDESKKHHHRHRHHHRHPHHHHDDRITIENGDSTNQNLPHETQKNNDEISKESETDLQIKRKKKRRSRPKLNQLEPSDFVEPVKSIDTENSKSVLSLRQRYPSNPDLFVTQSNQQDSKA